jgi:hypothetical protein
MQRRRLPPENLHTRPFGDLSHDWRTHPRRRGTAFPLEVGQQGAGYENAHESIECTRPVVDHRDGGAAGMCPDVADERGRQWGVETG